MFRIRKKSRQPQPATSVPADAIPFLKAADLLAPHEAIIKKIRNDSGATRQFFDTYYLPAIERVAEMLQLRPFGHDGQYAKKGGAIEITIKRVALSLKLRLGALLPLNCKPEEIAHRSEAWTYGLFVSSLLRDFGGQMLGVSIIGFNRNDKQVGVWQCWKDSIDTYHHYRMRKVPGVSRSLSYTSTVLHVKDIIPIHGIEWLYNDADLLDCVLDILAGTHKIHDNALYSLITKASSTLRDDISFDAAIERIESERPEKLAPKKQAQSKQFIEQIDTETGEVLQVEVSDPPTDQVPTTTQHHEQQPANSMPEPPAMEELHQRLEEYHVEADLEVTAKNLVSRLKLDIKKNRISPEYAKLKGNTVEVKYPSTFRAYTDSPVDMLNELRLLGVIESEGERKGVSADRVITLKCEL